MASIWWWSRGDSNPLPLRCERNVLPSELRPRVTHYRLGRAPRQVKQNAVKQNVGFLWSVPPLRKKRRRRLECSDRAKLRRRPVCPRKGLRSCGRSSRPISRVLYPPQADGDHLSSPDVTIGVMRPTRGHVRAPFVPLFGLAPGGVCTAGRSPGRW